MVSVWIATFEDAFIQNIFGAYEQLHEVVIDFVDEVGTDLLLESFELLLDVQLHRDSLYVVDRHVFYFFV